jgi:hypothetical protein
LPWKNKFISGTANKLFKGNKHFSTSWSYRIKNTI